MLEYPLYLKFLPMPQDIAERFHQQAEFREIVIKHGWSFDLADELHERQTRFRERFTVVLNLERSHVREMPVTARIIGAIHD